MRGAAAPGTAPSHAPHPHFPPSSPSALPPHQWGPASQNQSGGVCPCCVILRASIPAPQAVKRGASGRGRRERRGHPLSLATGLGGRACWGGQLRSRHFLLRTDRARWLPGTLANGDTGSVGVWAGQGREGPGPSFPAPGGRLSQDRWSLAEGEGGTVQEGRAGGGVYISGASGSFSSTPLATVPWVSLRRRTRYASK